MVNRPDLEEFLSALNGFLEVQAAVPAASASSSDQNFSRFLDIFCRSVGSADGHLLVPNEGALYSVLSCGLKSPTGQRASFDEQFNELSQNFRETLTPLDVAFEKQRVVAIVELKKSDKIPEWFSKLMERFGCKSLIAVPLINRKKATGLLCAYYRDACLFDQGTIDRLSVMGRMIGSATNSSSQNGAANEARRETVRTFLNKLITQPFTKVQLFHLLNETVVKTLSPLGAICGTVRSQGTGHAVSVVAGHSLPSSVISQRLPLPDFLEAKMTTGQWPLEAQAVPSRQFELWAPFVKASRVAVLAEPIRWHNRILGLVTVWRAEDEPFQKEDELFLQDITNIASLALNTQ